MEKCIFENLSYIFASFSAAARNAKRIIASVNHSQPRTFGDTEIHISQIDALVETEVPIFELPLSESSDEERRIGKWIAEELVDNGATLQLGTCTWPLKDRLIFS
jgi:acyl-CoA hydrolase